MISVPLAKQLRAAGLDWQPRRFDFFHIPDRDLDERVFVIADLSVDVQPLADGIAAITFNGAVEWSLDYILQQDVVWMPTEAQLRSLLGDRITSLQRSEDGWICVVDHPVERHDAATASDAYGKALLAILTGARE
ncbi:MAG: pilus assembly protein CpaE [Acidimicrobiia bacterium]